MNVRTRYEVVRVEVPASVPIDLTKEQVAAVLQVGTRMIEHLVREGKLGFYRHGSRIRFGEHHVAAYRASREVKPVTIRKVA